MSKVQFSRNPTALPNLAVVRPKSKKKVVHFNESANEEFIVPARNAKCAEDDKDHASDRTFERSLESGKMSDAELMEEVLKLCGWYEGVPETMPPVNSSNSVSDGTSGVFSWDDFDTTPSSSTYSSKSRISKKFSTRNPSVSSLFEDLQVSVGHHPYHPYYKAQKKKSFMRSDSVSLTAMSKVSERSSLKDTDFFSNDILEDAFRGIVHDDNNTTVVFENKSVEFEMEETPEEGASGNFWDDVEF